MALHVKFKIQADNKKTVLEDVSLYVPSLLPYKGNFKFEGPAGIIYINPGYETNDYTNPDTDIAASDVTTDEIAFPVGTDGKILPGDYTISYKVETGDEPLFGTNIYRFDYEAPKAVITPVVEHSLSKMLITDNTNYQIYSASQYVNQGNDLDGGERTWNVRFPINAGTVLVTKHTSPMYAGPNLWTGNYDIALNVNMQWDFDLLPLNDFTLSVEITDILLGKNDTAYVTRGECISSVLTALTELTRRYEEAKNNNWDTRDSLKTTIEEISWYYSMYNMAMLMGEDTTYYCNQLTLLLGACGYSCTPDSSATEELLPVQGLSGAGAGDIALYIYEAEATEGQTVFTWPITMTVDTPVFVNGILQSEGTDWTGVGTKTLTFMAPKSEFDIIQVLSTEQAT